MGVSKMKSETEIAKENVGKLGELLSPDKYVFMGKCQEHLASCQRFLEFLEQLRIDKTWDVCWIQEDGVNIKDKITDLNSAIKIYSDGGIK